MNGRKAFIVKVELDVQAVTCPGVWLSSNGQVSLQIYMLDSCVQTACLRPSFPMLFHEQFMFSKTLPTRYHLEDLSKQLSREWLYVELIQWEDCQSGNVLAYFQIPLNQFLYPTVSGGIPSGAEVDLLMETTPVFPGPLAPKLEVSNRTTIEETICSCNRQKLNTSVVNNRKSLLLSDCPTKRQTVACHCPSNKTYRNRKCKPTCAIRCTCYGKPPWRYKKVEDGFLQRKPVMHLPPKPTTQLELDGGIDCGPYAGPRRSQPDGGMDIKRVLQDSFRRAMGNTCPNIPCPQEDLVCCCEGSHLEAACPVCQKYNGVFSSTLAQRGQPKKVLLSTNNPDKSLYNQLRRHSKQNSICNDDICAELNNLGKKLSVCKAHCDQPNVYSLSCHAPERKETLTKRIHDRVCKTLRSIPSYIDDVKDICMDVGESQPESNQCTCRKLPNMGQFYRELFEEEHREK